MSTQCLPVQLRPENPRYLAYKGKPLVLITATEHYGAVLNRNVDHVRYLDDAADKQATLTRGFLLFREADRREVNEPGYGEPCSGSLAITLPAGHYCAQLYDPVQGECVGDGTSVTGGQAWLTINPFVHDRVVHIHHKF